MKVPRVPETIRWLVYLSISIALIIVSITFLNASLSYMERNMVATSLLSALAGFTLLSASLYSLRLSAYVYSIAKEAGEK